MILNQLFENQPAASGSAYDRGGADAWYHRGRHPHKIVDGREVALTDPEEIADYNRGYDDEGIEGRDQGKQYDEREETSDSCDAFRHNLRQQVQQRAASDQADVAIAQARDPGQWQWRAGDQVLSKKTGKTYSIIGPALDRKHGAMYLYQRGEKGSPDWEQGRFIADKAHRSLVKINESDVVEAKPVAQTIDHAVWSKKSPDDQRFLKQLHPNLKITNVPPPPRAEKPPKVKPDLWKIAVKAENVLGNIFPDGDPVDYMYPYLKSLGIPIDKQFDVLNKAIKLHVDKKGYYHWLEASWDNVAKDRQMPDIVRLDNNPWRTEEGVAEETGDEKFDTMLGNIVKDTPTDFVLSDPVSGVLFKKGFKTKEQAEAYNQKKEKGYYSVCSYQWWRDEIEPAIPDFYRKKGVAEDELTEKWSEKYKRSINCASPKGFSQRAHCAGRRKDESAPNTRYILYLNGKAAAHYSTEKEAKSQADLVSAAHPNTKIDIKPVQAGLIEGLRDPKDNPCWKGYHPVGTKKKGGRKVPNCVPKSK